MNKSIDELEEENVLAKKSLDEQKQTESASENEESDTVTEQSSSSASSSSETTNTQNSLSNSSKTTNFKHKSHAKKSYGSTVTQFSVQRSDVDGLRMKISAIRPTITTSTTTAATATATTNTSSLTKSTSNSKSYNQAAAARDEAVAEAVPPTAATVVSNAESNREVAGQSGTRMRTKAQSKAMHYNNNNSLTKPLTVKLSDIKLQQKALQRSKQTTTTAAATAVRPSEPPPPCVADTVDNAAAQSRVWKSCGADAKHMSVNEDDAKAQQTDIVGGGDRGGGGDGDGAENRSTTEICNAAATLTTQELVMATTQAELSLPVSLPLSLPLPHLACLSDGTAESGCSEATTTTIATGNAKTTTTRRVRVKRKKVQSKLLQEQQKKSALSAAAAVLRSAQTQQLHNLMTYTSDSEDDMPPQQLQQQQQQQEQLQKRAPRLLLTAINSTSATTTIAAPSEAQIKNLVPPACNSSAPSALTPVAATFSHGSDNSDNELKLDDVVNAVIKCVESDGDDVPAASEVQRKSRARRVPQYQSTLLQDFMEKTQMLGSNSGSSSGAPAEAAATDAQNIVTENLVSATPQSKITTAEAIVSANQTVRTQAESEAASKRTATTSTAVIKKKRGRPKKVATAVATSSTTTTTPLTVDTTHIPCAPTNNVAMTNAALTATHNAMAAASINESADSGVISTTSTTATQSSTSPSPKLVTASATLAFTATTPSSQKRRQHQQQQLQQQRAMEPNERERQTSISPCKSQTQDGSGSCSTNSPKPKIDIAYLDKRMYAATERVLYPPPRNKRRQSVGAPSQHSPSTPSSRNAINRNASAAATNANATTSAAGSATTAREELQLDPVWRKIDVNKKFRRPSLSGYKSDGGGGNTTICSKILAAKSGYVSDYGSFHARALRDHSGYKSDASGKSRYSMKSCASRRSRAKSCGYRSDCKDGKDGGASLKSAKYRRKRRSALMRAHSKSVGNLAGAAATTNLLVDAEKDILQLAGLSLGQSSEESNEYVCKPNLESLPTTSASKKYGEINRFIATGEYFGRGSSSNSSNTNNALMSVFASNLHEHGDGGSGSQDGHGFSRNKLLLQRKQATDATCSSASGGVGVAAAGSAGVGVGAGLCGGAVAAHNMLLSHGHTSRKIKSRRSSIASYCSSYYSNTTKVRKRHRRKSFLRFPSAGKSGAVIDSKLLTEIDILINTFGARCRIQSGGGGGGEKSSGGKEKIIAESGAGSGGSVASSKVHSSSSNPPPQAGTSSGSRREQRDKRSMKKRKMSENQEYALMAAGAGGGGAGGGGNLAALGGALMAGGGSGSGSTKRRHKKANSSSSPDDHKLPLKKRHYLLTPGDKSTEAAAAAAVAAKLFGSTAVEAWAAAVASTKLASGAGKTPYNPQQFGALCGSSATLSVAGSTHSGSTTKSSTKGGGGGGGGGGGRDSGSGGLTPKKRQFPLAEEREARELNGRELVGAAHTPKRSNSSPLRIAIDNTLSHKMLDISPISLAGSTSRQSEAVHRKRSRLEVLVSKIVATTSNVAAQGQSNAGGDEKDTTAAMLQKQKQSACSSGNQQADTPPPGIFEPTVALEIQIPPIARLNDAASNGAVSGGGAAGIVTKAEVNSPLLLQELTPTSVTAAATATAKTEGGGGGGGATVRALDTQLNKTCAAASMLLKRKRKKINRTGFPNVRRRKKSKVNEQLLLNIVENEQVQQISPMRRRSHGLAKQATAQVVAPMPIADGGGVGDAASTPPTPPPQATAAASAALVITSTPEKAPCDRVPVSGEASDSFLERANRTPRLSVVALERLRGAPTPTTNNSPTPTTTTLLAKSVQLSATPAAEVIQPHKENALGARKGRAGRKPKASVAAAKQTSQAADKAETSTSVTENAPQTPRKSKSDANLSQKMEAPPINNSLPTTPKSSKRGRAANATTTIKHAKVANATTTLERAKVANTTPTAERAKVANTTPTNERAKVANATTTTERAKATSATPTSERAKETVNNEKTSTPSLTTTNNASTPRARGRRPKLSAVAIVKNAPSTPAVATVAVEMPSKMNLKSTVTQISKISKAPASPHTKQTRRVVSTTPTTIALKTPQSDRPASFTKSTVHKIITAKSLESKVKLPAGIDPNTNFSCKIRLKRPSTKKAGAGAALLHCTTTNALRQSLDSIAGDGSSIKDVPQSTPEQIAMECAAKDSSIDYPEQDILPRSETPLTAIDSEAATASDTSDEKCSTITSSTSTSSVSLATAATVARKVARLKRNYLTAGLFSDYFKQAHAPMAHKRSSLEKKDASALVAATTTTTTNTAVTDASAAAAAANAENIAAAPIVAAPSLPPPPYCEQYFRRTQIDFQLPYDIWWAYTHSKLPTRITVPSWNFRKIRTNIYADAVRPNMAGFDHPTCNCKPDQGCGDRCLNRMVYTECSPTNCPAREKCRNQKIQRHEVAPGVERFMTTDKGWGVRTKLPIRKGTYILEYVGEVVTEREFKDRMGTIYLNDTHHYCLHLDGGLVIDGHRMGSDCRFVNHSCEPNCEMQKWSVNGLSRMALFAKRNIEPGEELSYDYNFSLFNPSEGQPCRCNTPQCRGVIGGKSQRIKPLPIELKSNECTPKDERHGRARKRQARKNTERVHSKDVVISHGQQLSEKEKRLVKLHGIFLVRNFEKIRRCKAKIKANASTSDVKVNGIAHTTPSALNTPNSAAVATKTYTPSPIMTRRSSTPASLTALRSPRGPKARGLTHAVQDPEVEKMAKIAVILRDICMSLELIKDPKDKKQTLAAVALANNASAGGAAANAVDGGATTDAVSGAGGGKRKKTSKTPTKAATKAMATTTTTTVNLKTVQTNVEQGYYKLPTEFNADMQKVFELAQQLATKGSRQQAALQQLITAYESKKREAYTRLLDIVGGDETVLAGFLVAGGSIGGGGQAKFAEDKHKVDACRSILQDHGPIDPNATIITPTSTEDIIRCICGLHKDEGLMIQCARCMVWQHTECTKADVKADNYLCERCEPRIVDREIALDDYTEEGHRYYLTLMRGDLHVRQGDAVYVLRDIPVKDAAGNVVPKQKHTYETIGHIDYNECDIFRVERLWKNEDGKRFIFGHHFLRPHETFHEPTRRFYPNEVVRVPLYEVVPIELVIGRCWVLDRTTFCKGRPVECTDEVHCYICELRVDKTARFFSKAKVNYPICTKTYAFRKFPERLKISKSYAPHDVDPTFLKPKRTKVESDPSPNAKHAANHSLLATSDATLSLDKTPQPIAGRRRRNSCIPTTVHTFTVIPPSQKTMKLKRTHLESVLDQMKLKQKLAQTTDMGQPIDLSYLLSGRSGRPRKQQQAPATPITTTKATASSSAATATTNTPTTTTATKNASAIASTSIKATAETASTKAYASTSKTATNKSNTATERTTTKPSTSSTKTTSATLI